VPGIEIQQQRIGGGVAERGLADPWLPEIMKTVGNFNRFRRAMIFISLLVSGEGRPSPSVSFRIG